MAIKIKGEKRETFGKSACRQLRNKGKLPAVLYGEKISAVPLTVEKRDVIGILKSDTGENTIFQVAYDSKSQDVMIKEIQTNPVTDELLHVDLVQIVSDKVIRVSIPVVAVGEAVGVKTEGGFVDYVTREVEVECLPTNIPENLEVDISELHVNQSLKVEDLTFPEGVKVIDEKDTVLINIDVPHEEEVIEEEKEEEVIAEEEEPEVIKKEKEEAEEEGGAEEAKSEEKE